MPLTHEMLDLNPGLPCSRMGEVSFSISCPPRPFFGRSSSCFLHVHGKTETVAEVEPGRSASVDGCRGCYLEVPRGIWEVASLQS